MSTGNHTAYKQIKGTKTSAAEILELYEGLRQSNLSNFDVLLTGYMPSAEAVQAIGKIGRDIKFNAGTKPGSFFWGRLALGLHWIRLTKHSARSGYGRQWQAIHT
jgi:pyridoxine kinase